MYIFVYNILSELNLHHRMPAVTKKSEQRGERDSLIPLLHYSIYRRYLFFVVVFIVSFIGQQVITVCEKKSRGGEAVLID